MNFTIGYDHIVFSVDWNTRRAVTRVNGNETEYDGRGNGDIPSVKSGKIRIE